MTRSGFLPVAIAAGLLVPASVRAQGVGPAPAAPGTARGNQWGLTLQFDESWDSNARFGVNAQDSLVHRGSVSMTHGRRGRRGTLSLSARGSAVAYSAGGLDHGTYGGTLALTHALSRRASVGLSGSGESSYASEDPALLQSGIVLPPALTRLYSAQSRINVSPAAWLTAGADARHERRSFENDPSLPQLLGGSTTTATAFVSPRLSRRDAIVLTYEFRRSAFSAGDAATQGATFGWTRTIANSFTASLSGGGTRFRVIAGADPRWTVRAAAALALNRRRTSLSAQYERAVDQAYGVARNRIADVARVAWSLSPTRTMGLALSATYSFNGDPDDPTLRTRTAFGTAQLTQAIGHGMQLRGAYGYRMLHGVTAQSSGHIVAVSLGYSRAWPRSRAPRR